jgi:hypothetical protein
VETKTGKYQKGDKIKLTQTTAKYFYIIAISYSSPNTTVTVTGGSDYTVANAAITLPYFSKIENPQGFPEFFAVTAPTFSSTGTGFTNQPTLYWKKFKISGKMCYVYIGGRANAASGATGQFIMTFSAGQIPTSFVGYASGVFLNMSTAKNGFLVFEDGVTTMRFYAYDGTTPFTNNDYFGLSGWYPYAA